MAACVDSDDEADFVPPRIENDVDFGVVFPAAVDFSATPASAADCRGLDRAVQGELLSVLDPDFDFA